MARWILLPLLVVSSIISTVLCGRVDVVHEVHVRHVNQPHFPLMPRYTNTSNTGYTSSTSSSSPSECAASVTTLTTFTAPSSLSTSSIVDITTNTHTTIDGTSYAILYGCSTYCFAGPTGIILSGIPDVPGVYPPPTSGAPSGFPTITIGDDFNPTICQNECCPTTTPAGTDTPSTTFAPPASLATSNVDGITANTHTTIDGTPVPVLYGCSFCPSGPTGIALSGIPDVPGVYPPPSGAPSDFPTITIGSDLNPTISSTTTGPVTTDPGTTDTTVPGSGLTTLPPPASLSTSTIDGVSSNTHTTINGTPVPVLQGCGFCPAGLTGLILGGIPDVPGVYPPPSGAPSDFPTITIGEDLNPTPGPTADPNTAGLITQPPPSSVSTSTVVGVTANTHTTIDGVPVPILSGCGFCPVGPLGLLLGGIPDVPGIYPPPATPPFPGFPAVTIGEDLNPTVDSNSVTTDATQTTETTQTTDTEIPTETIPILTWPTWESRFESEADDQDAAAYAESMIAQLWPSMGSMPPGQQQPPPANQSISVQIWRINMEITGTGQFFPTSQTMAIQVGVNDTPNPCADDHPIEDGNPDFLWSQFEPYHQSSVSIPSKFDLHDGKATGCTFSGTFGQTGTLACDNNFNVNCYMYAGQTGYGCGGQQLIGCSATTGDCLPSYWKVADCNF